MSDKPMSKLDQTRTEIETLLRQFQAWGLVILHERKADLARSIAESGGQIPLVEASETDQSAADGSAADGSVADGSVADGSVTGVQAESVET